MMREAAGPEQWIEQTQGLVRSLAYGIHKGLPHHVQVEDIIAYGQVGLLQAAKAYNADFETSFQTFAYYRIRGAMFDGLGKMAWTSRSAQKKLATQRAVHEIFSEEQQDDGAAESANQAESLQSAAGWLVRTTEKLAVVQLLATDSDGQDQGNSPFEDRSERPDEVVARSELQDILGSLVKNLPEIERSLIELTYYEGKTLAEAARELGHSKSWASRLHSQILQRLARSVSLANAT